jgi:phage tail sheath protein FI
VQLAYPWARTPGSARLPEQLESPDGVLAGLLARSALQSGAWQSAAGLDLADVYDVFPRPWHRELLAQRISLFGPTPDGLQSLSDVTTASFSNYRPACVNRLVSVIVRAARRIGEEVAFESSGPVVWGKLRGRMGVLLSSLYQLGALRGATAADAFAVRCDPSTMTQNDIDAGRAIARVEFQASAPVERISVVLALTDGGQVSLSGTAREEAA